LSNEAEYVLVESSNSRFFGVSDSESSGVSFKYCSSTKWLNLFLVSTDFTLYTSLTKNSIKSLVVVIPIIQFFFSWAICLF
jgi:hypothetical protein